MVSVLFTKYRHILKLSITFSIILTTTYANASQVTFRYDGIFTHVGDIYKANFSTGDTFTGTYTFETTITDRTIPGFDSQPGPFYSNNILSMSFSSGNYSVSGKIDQFNKIQVVGRRTLADPSIIEPHYFASFRAPLFGPSFGITWDIGQSTALPLLSFCPDFLNDFDTSTCGQDLKQGTTIASDDPGFNGTGELTLSPTTAPFNEERRARGMITSVTVVPIPAAIWLFGTGIIGLFAWNRRRIA